MRVGSSSCLLNGNTPAVKGNIPGRFSFRRHLRTSPRSSNFGRTILGSVRPLRVRFKVALYFATVHDKDQLIAGVGILEVLPFSNEPQGPGGKLGLDTLLGMPDGPKRFRTFIKTLVSEGFGSGIQLPDAADETLLLLTPSMVSPHSTGDL